MTVVEDLLSADAGKRRGSIFITPHRVRCRRSAVGPCSSACSPSRLHAWPTGLYLVRLRADRPVSQQRCRSRFGGLVRVAQVVAP